MVMWGKGHLQVGAFRRALSLRVQMRIFGSLVADLGLDGGGLNGGVQCVRRQERGKDAKISSTLFAFLSRNVAGT